MIGDEDAWTLIKALPNFYNDEEESSRNLILMNDVWGWACGDAIELNEKNIERVAELYNRYGFCGLLYFQIEAGDYKKSEFTDNNRFIQFVQNEERIRKEEPGYNKRGYYKAKYTIDGELNEIK